MGKLLHLKLAGAPARCSRCAEACLVATGKDPDARLLRHSATPDGLCVNCAVAEWFFLLGLRGLVTDVTALRLPHVQERFVSVLKTGGSDAAAAEIDWAHVERHWDLPFKTSGDGAIKPPTAKEATGRMTDPPPLPREPRRKRK